MKVNLFTMKVNLFTLSLSCLLLAVASDSRAATAPDTATAGTTTPAATAPQSRTKQTEELLRAFYTDYCTLIAESKDPTAPQRLLDNHLTPQARRKTEGLDYMPLIRAQDFNAKALRTITVTHVDGQWYAAAYLDTYDNTCVVIPVKATVEQGVLRITDFRIP